jgi:hypothetical protein
MRDLSKLGLRASSGISASPVGFGSGNNHRSGGIEADQSFGTITMSGSGCRQPDKASCGKCKTDEPGPDHIA